MSACSNTQVPFVHRMEIPQGNVVTKDMVEKLEPGLTKRQVTYIMGSPMLVDVFNQEQWMYLYSFEPSSGKRVQRQLALGFENDALVRVSGDVNAITETPLAVQSAEGTSRSVEVPEGVGAGYNDGGILQRVIDRFKGLNPWSGKGREETAKGNDSGGAAPTASSEAGTNTMRKFSLEEKDIATADPPDTDREVPTPAGRRGGEETAPNDDSSTGWRLKFGSDAANQAFAPTSPAADSPPRSRPAAANQPPKAAQAEDGPGFFSRLNSTLNPWADGEDSGSDAPTPSAERRAGDTSAGMKTRSQDTSTAGTETVTPVLRRAKPGDGAPQSFMAGSQGAGARGDTSTDASGEYPKHRLIFDRIDIGAGEGSGADEDDAEWKIRVKGPLDSKPHQPFASSSPKSSPKAKDTAEDAAR